MNTNDRVNRILQDAADLASEVQKLKAENTRLKDRQNNKKKLTPREVARIRELRQEGNWTNRAIADAYDVNPATVSRITRGIYWK